MTINMHIQCELRRASEKGYHQNIAWLPAEYAVEGKFVKLKTNGEWEDGWKVQTAYTNSPIASEVIQERSRDYKNHRKATDV